MVQLIVGLFVAILLVAVAAVVLLNWVLPMTGAKLLQKLLRNKVGLVQKQLQVKGLDVPYLVAGNGEPLVLVHGFTANKDTFNAMAPYLTSRYTVYTLDLPGHGDAERDLNADFSMEALVEYVRRFVQALRINRVHLVGSSMGGGVVSFYAARYPDEVASVWLIGAAVTREFLTDSEHIKRYDATGTFPYLIQNHAEHARKLDMVFGKPAKMPHCLKVAFAQTAIRDYAIHGAILKQVRKTIPVDQIYSNLSTPALIVTGDNDLVVPPSSVHTLAKVFPQSTLQVIEGAGHIPMVERPRRCAHDYLQFRTKIEA